MGHAVMNMPGLPMDLVQELNVSTVEERGRRGWLNWTLREILKVLTKKKPG